MTPPAQHRPNHGRTETRKRCRAFTLIELLTVIAIIGILAGILIPTVSGVRRSADKARTRVMFNQWAAAIEAFRSEYGYYPAFDTTNLVNPVGQNTTASTLHKFHDVLAARRRDGSALPTYSSAASSSGNPEVQNRKLIVFHSFSEAELTSADSEAPNLIKDASGNTEIAVLVDRNLDGVINSSDYGALPLVKGARPATTDIPTTGIRAGVAFYAPAPDSTEDAPKFIFSWK